MTEPICFPVSDKICRVVQHALTRPQPCSPPAPTCKARHQNLAPAWRLRQKPKSNRPSSPIRRLPAQRAFLTLHPDNCQGLDASTLIQSSIMCASAAQPARPSLQSLDARTLNENPIACAGAAQPARPSLQAAAAATPLCSRCPRHTTSTHRATTPCSWSLSWHAARAASPTAANAPPTPWLAQRLLRHLWPRPAEQNLI